MSGAVRVSLGLTSVLAAAGLGIALYLAVVHYAGQPIVCTGIGDCEYVNSSEYADIGGVPVAALGAGAYATMLALAGYTLVRGSAIALSALWGVAAASFAFSLYLTYVELFVLEAICAWCVGSAALATGIFLLASFGAWRSAGSGDAIDVEADARAADQAWTARSGADVMTPSSAREEISASVRRRRWRRT